MVASALALVYGLSTTSTGTTGRWLGVALLGALAGASRPIGVLLMVPIAVEAWRHRGRGWLLGAQLLAILGPALGMGAFLLWVRRTFGDALLPLRVQTESGHHGSLSDPVTGILHGVSLASHGHLSAVVHLPWVAVALVALVVGARRLPLSATLYGAVIVVVALGGQNLDSFERYLLAAPTIFFVMASWLQRRWLRMVVLVTLAGGLVATSVLVFADYLVP